MAFHNAQVCLNGHVITTYAEWPDRCRKFCPQCGERTINKCEKKTGCTADIPGKESVGWSQVVEDLTVPPSFCHECGEPYPWTERRSAALADAIDELDQLPEADREKLKQSIPDVIQDTPKTQTASARFTKAISAAGAWGGKMLTEILTKVATEAVLQQVGLKP
jgi:hypothetical protein